MELKLLCDEKPQDTALGASFNRTSVELKLDIPVARVLFDLGGFNRTSVELKRVDLLHNRKGLFIGFNRTSVELKQPALNVVTVTKPALIEPVWN